MRASNRLIMVKGEEKTASIRSLRYEGAFCFVQYKGSDKVYRYEKSHVQTLPRLGKYDGGSVIFRVQGQMLSNLRSVEDFGAFYRATDAAGQQTLYPLRDVQFSSNCLAEENCKQLFDYFKKVADVVSLKTDDGLKLLQLQYDRITKIDPSTALSKFLQPSRPLAGNFDPGRALLFPFGVNQSQKKAVRNAFSSQVSLIQGPPGTGKTQTILNIIANAVCSGKTVAVVSNNNSAIRNVLEKLEREDLSFLVALLGSKENKEAFLASQTGSYPNMASWQPDQAELKRLPNHIHSLSLQLDKMFEMKNRAAQLQQELLELQVERGHFEEYSKHQNEAVLSNRYLRELSSKQLMHYWLLCENKQSIGRLQQFFTRLRFWANFGPEIAQLYRNEPHAAIVYFQKYYYPAKEQELRTAIQEAENFLRNSNYNEILLQLQTLSMRLLKGTLFKRYHSSERQRFEMKDFRSKSAKFVAEYPIVLSTTHSIAGTLNSNFTFDYVIVDEASQVDLATGVLAMAVAQNIVIVGDQKQLPNVLSEKDRGTLELFAKEQHIAMHYNAAVHSLLSSAAAVWSNAPSVLLREHYRCHPKIAGFFNAKFYDGQLVVMTTDKGEDNVLSLYRTAKGNHARGHVNQRQIDVIESEILPEILGSGYTDIGIITPYRAQATAIQKRLNLPLEVDTVHKFQGREKDAIILTSVDNTIGDFVDDPNMLNVAVSRAVKSLSVVVSADDLSAEKNYGDLIKYIEYNNLKIVESKVHSVFDLLYKDYAQQRNAFLKKRGRISEYDSENLAYALISQILREGSFSAVDCASHTALRNIIRDRSLLHGEKLRYATNPNTHLDFLLYHKMDKRPILAIEIDGTSFHAEGSRQAERDILKDEIMSLYGIPLLRIRTDESGVHQRITSALRHALHQ